LRKCKRKRSTRSRTAATIERLANKFFFLTFSLIGIPPGEFVGACLYKRDTFIVPYPVSVKEQYFS
jgi:hypothetical protein